MNLNKQKIKKIISYSIWGIIGLVLAIFFIKVAIWEANYYSSKEGSERATAISASEETVEEETVDETVPTEEEVASWASTLPDYYPAYMTISSIGQIGRQVAAIGTTSSGALSTPTSIYKIGWYNASSAPGQGGVGVYDGHNGGPYAYGVFKKLPLLCAEGEVGTRSVPNDASQGTRECTGEGDTIAIESADGKSYVYTVVENVTVSLDESDSYMVKAFSTPVHGKESISIISCTGEWSQVKRTYLSRQFVRAVLK